ncbi:MAG: methyltransferase domain-containing protein [Polyangiaceae bacterium]
MDTYVAEGGGASEAARLKALQGGLDANTIRYLNRLGVRPGDVCLEIGAGGGSVACWMARMVGPSGSVVATDLDTDQFAAAAADHANLIGRTEDVAEGVAPHPDGRLFDLAHARLVVGHVRDHDRAISNIVRAVRPGGWVLIEDADFLWLALTNSPFIQNEPYPSISGSGRRSLSSCRFVGST